MRKILVPALMAAFISSAALAAELRAAPALPSIAGLAAAKSAADAPFDAVAPAPGLAAVDATDLSPSPEGVTLLLAAPEKQRARTGSTPPQAPRPEIDRPFFVRHYWLARLMLSPLLNLVYRVRVSGAENIFDGPQVIVPNHVSYVDAIMISFAANRPMRFMMERRLFERAPRFLGSLGAIPVSSKDNPALIEESLERARRALRDGQSVVIFPEGRLTLTGNMNGFRSGFERIVAGAPAPVVPAYLDGLWGSLFSLKKGESVWSRLKDLPRPVSIRFGPALETPKSHAARLAVSELAAASMENRVRTLRRPLALEFFKTARKYWSRPALRDSTGKKLSYGKTLAGAVLLGGALAGRLPEGNTVGVLMPPIVEGGLVNLALATQGRTPINLNYSATNEIIEHSLKVTDASAVVTSRKFLEILEKERGFKLPPSTRVVFLEDVAPEIPPWKKTAVFLALKILPNRIAESIFLPHASRNFDDAATVLFTSGSTSLPKGAELTQMNIMSDIEMTRELLALKKDDVILSVLPLFHSFGYTVTFWLPLLSGITVAFHPRATDETGIEKFAREARPTILFGTPSFLQRYAQKIAADAFSRLRLVIAGAEKLRPAIADEFLAKFGVRVYEGYGTTELSPVAASGVPDVGNQTGSSPGSVGRALPGQAVKAVDLLTGALLGPDEEGMLMAKGPNVMRGYLGEPEKTAKVLKNGWYETGDLGSVDRDGYIRITGRQGRFTKPFGEKISDVEVEEKLQEAAGTVELTFFVGGAPDPVSGEKFVVLYAGWHGDIDALLAKMAELGVPRIRRPLKENFHEVAAIPLLGSGKLDLQTARKLVSEKEPGPAPR